MNEIKQTSVVVDVSHLSPDGWWLGNEKQHVAKGTALGADYTETLYTPTAEGLTSRFDRETQTWSEEIINRTATPYYSIEGREYRLASPDSAVPEAMLVTPPPDHDPNTQAVLHDGEKWQVFDIKVGQSYWDKSGREYVVSDDYFALPNECTWERPPAARENYAVRLVQGKWEEVEDHRGKEIFNKAECLQVELVEELGPIKDGWTLTAPPTPFHEYKNGTWQPSTDRAKKAKRKEINAWRVETENDVRATVVANDTVWDAGPEARMRIDSTILAGVMPPYWTDANNQDHHGMSIEELKQVKAAINLQGFTLHDKQRKMKQEVDKLESFEAVLAFKVGQQTV
ncbi:DUF4376 domain-containing protein [Grimontia marina]|uniref:DUF4376 domain-containing protein n=1 Tax=Grimontia marina TaxID=646534 RepID=A0A128FG64_9GAMM|nr:DUF4376 domain-containing protein [Grimontia marina]CZF85485.1 hypothetical protein GMA8713_03551 [Grimontia marina]